MKQKNSTLTPAQIKKTVGISYLGGCNSPKLVKSLERNVMTYGVYLTPGNLSGYQVCPNSDNCCKYCLNGSGRNKIELLTYKDGGPIQQSRIKKTKLFFENRPAFMRLLVHEINQARKKADAVGMTLAIRLNCTSDISPEEFILDGKNILQLYPDIQFYDYTKVFNRTRLLSRYKNYDLTFSFSGENWTDCEMVLKKGYRVAVVFEDILPETFRNYPVIDANGYDARFLDTGGTICGLTYKRVANDYVTGKYQRPETTFVNRNVKDTSEKQQKK
ncbi:MAG: hypothetical protein LUD40_07960 [Phocaeicola dorei]|nr:hypothetical protein [Phocaeicola dorei]